MRSRLLHHMHGLVTVLFLLLIILPLIPMVLSSFSAGWRWPEVIPGSFSLRSWEYLFSASAGTWQAIGVSLQIAVFVTLINLVLAIPAANALARTSFAGKRWIEALLFAPIIIPPFVAVMGMNMTFIRLGFTETVMGVVLAHLAPALPYMIRALMISFSTLGYQWEEQAQILGAGWFRRFVYIVFPHILPGILAGSILSILVSLSQYLITFLVGGGQVITLPLLMFPFLNGGDPAIGSAYALLFAGVALFMLWVIEGLLRRYYRSAVSE
jgi:putative spermidine/putrescine transport system permease protein